MNGFIARLMMRQSSFVHCSMEWNCARSSLASCVVASWDMEVLVANPYFCLVYGSRRPAGSAPTIHHAFLALEMSASDRRRLGSFPLAVRFGFRRYADL